MKVLVTGGAGYIGAHVVVELCAAGYEPVMLDTMINSDQVIYQGVQQITGQDIPHYNVDTRDTAEVTRIMRKHHIEAVIHLAAFKAVGESVEQPLKYYSNNLGGIISVLQAMQEAGAKYFIFSSSTVVYGRAKVLPMTEETPLRPPANPYGATKQMSEQIIRDTCQASGIQAISLRYFNPIGAHPSGLIGELPIGVPTFLMPYILQTVAGVRKELVIFGSDYDTADGTPVRDYLHVVDLAKAHQKALAYLQAASEPFNVFNIGTGTGTTVLQLVQAFERAAGVKVPYKLGPRRPGDIASSYASPAKAAKELGWKAEMGLEQALADAWNWQQKLEKQVY